MSDERRREWKEGFLAANLLLALCGMIGPGCGEGGGTPGKAVSTGNQQDAFADALRRLEKDKSATSCRSVLQAINSGLTLPEPRPELTAEQIRSVGSLLRLTEREAETLGAKDFSAVDDAYLEECLLLRDAVRSLELDELPPAKQAELVFAWVCRQIYIAEHFYPPAPPWQLLQAGSGSGLDRAQVFLAALRQVRAGDVDQAIGGCLIGPPELAEMPSVQRVGANLRYASVRAVGARVGGEILLFDPWSGQPVLIDGKVATLAQVRAKPEAVKEWLDSRQVKLEEARNWEVFLAAPLPAFAARSEWLERQIHRSMPGSEVRLYVDAVATLASFKSAANQTNVRWWNPPNDALDFVRVGSTFQLEERDGRGNLFKKANVEFRQSHFPWQFLPLPQGVAVRDALSMPGRPAELIRALFNKEFTSSFMADGSPRDQMLRGNFGTASASLTEQKDRNDTIRDRISQESSPEESRLKWWPEANTAFGELARAEESGDTSALAQANLGVENFLKSPVHQKMESLIQRQTSRLLGAEATYLLALLVHEQAERAQAHLKAQPEARELTEVERSWKIAAEWWQRYLDNYPELRFAFKDRDDQAKRLLARCREQLDALKK
jgi:hypothetical protein